MMKKIACLRMAHQYFNFFLKVYVFYRVQIIPLFFVATALQDMAMSLKLFVVCIIHKTKISDGN